MDPATLTVLIPLFNKAIDAGVEVYKAWRETGGSGVAVGADGARYNLDGGGWRGHPVWSEPRSFGAGDPVAFDGVFVPADDWAQAYLVADQPVLVVIEDQDPRSRLDSVVTVMSLGDSFEGELFPGTYLLGAFVFLDDDATDWDDVDGGALVEFSVEPGEPPFGLEIAIEAAVEPEDVVLETAPVLQATGRLGPGEQDQYAVTLEADMTYHVYVNPTDPSADFDLYVYDENDNLVAVDDDPDSDALCSVIPAWTGPFAIVVECHSGQSAYEFLIRS